MIVNMQNELRDFTYITNLYKCIANYNLMGHQIGRKVGDMLEILTMGVVYQNNELKRHLSTEGKLEGYTSAGHKVEFGFFNNPRTKEGLFGAIECKCVGVEVTKNSQTASKHIKMSCVELLFPPTATLPQIKFSFSYILSILACCFLRHVFICPLDHSFSFPYSLFVTK